jgi:multisubunit Na+/H+ antiporter MnhB subunit
MVAGETLPEIVISDLIVGSACILLPIVYRKLTSQKFDRDDLKTLVMTFGGATVAFMAMDMLRYLRSH